MTRIGAIILFLLATTNGWANVSDWQDLGSITNNNEASGFQARSASTNVSPLQQYRRMLLNEESLHSSLNQVASSATNTQSRTATTTISLPLPDGSFASVTATPTQVLAPEIAAQHPEIQTWQVLGTDGKTLSGVIDFTTLGFHAMLDMPNGDTVFIDPQESNGQREYATFSKRDNAAAFKQDWTCGTQGKSSFRDLSSIMPDPSSAARNTAAKAGETLHTYRIAIAATGEYTQYKYNQYKADNPSGTSTAQEVTSSSISTTVSRINHIFKKDLSIELKLVENDNIIFIDPNTDPYTNNNPKLMLNENITVLNSIIGVNNYDIGHVFGTQGGGLAYVGSACTSYKASGVTGLADLNDAFDIDYVAHEIGHQFDADHTFNSVLNSCGGGRIQASAYEPGSGSTIMAYNDLCDSDNLQPGMGSDAMFHTISIAQIRSFAHTPGSTADSCAVKSSLGNTNPTANAGADYTIPAHTPFMLTGSGSDIDSNMLTYSWEQLDTGSASNITTDTSNNAIIRTMMPTVSSIRTIPDIPTLIGSGNQPGQILPSTSRTMHFGLVVRDDKGGIGFDSMQLNVVDSGAAFSVTSPASTNLPTLVNGTNLDVVWNKANTDIAPINCSNVDIAVSYNNGLNFINLATNTPNDGQETVNLLSAGGMGLIGVGHIRVKCSNNIFFAVSALNHAPQVASSNITTDPTPVEYNISSNINGGSSSSGGGSTGGGGGSFPLTWILPGAIYLLLRRRKGICS